MKSVNMQSETHPTVPVPSPAARFHPTTLLLDSDSDSDSDFSIHIQNTCNMSSALAIVHHKKPKAIPILFDGIIDPSVMLKYETAVKYCCMFAKIPAEEQVATIAWGVKHPDVEDWYHDYKAEFDALDLDTWLARMRTQFLPTNWIDNVHRKLINARQGKTQKFSTYLQHCQHLNNTLRSSKAQLDNKFFRAKVQAGLNITLYRLCQAERINCIENLDTWANRVTEVDNDRLLSELQYQERLAKMMRRMSTANANKSSKSSTTRIITTNSTDTTKTSKRLPPLTDCERKLLCDNDGCLKCRRPFAGHITRNCKIGFPLPSTYVPITADTVRKAHAAQSKSRFNMSTAVIEGSDNNDRARTSNILGTVFTSAILYSGIDSDSDCDKCVAPFRMLNFWSYVFIDASLVD